MQSDRKSVVWGVTAAACMAASAYTVTAYAQEATGTGEVRRIDAQAGKITLNHGPLSAFDLPAMTLVYRIDPVLLKDLKPGDKVRFTAQRQNGQYVIIQITR